MRIAQIVLPGASEYERKSQRVDAAALGDKVVALDDRPDVAHVYASGTLPPARFVRFPVPYVSSAPLPKSRFSLRKPVPPRAAAGRDELPEAVEEAYFSATRAPVARDVKIIGSFARVATRNMVEQTLSRIHRFRSDVTWNLYAHTPAPEDLAGVDAWVDPATAPDDLDGFVAEALVVGLPVVASRTPVNMSRLEQGRTGFLVPPGDPNEMTHAILSALFKAEVAESKQSAARQTVSKFRARQRLRILLALYESLI
ncbi:MAG TPA: glycosyltransferase [Thermoanaerobaculia bacterium]|nr:glycosyltransferase [Thermoanaerobaculia bacterium]